MSSSNNLTDIWNVYQDSIIKESKAARPIQGGTKNFTTKPGKGAVDMNSKEAKEVQNTSTTDIESIEGLEKPLDPKTTKKGKKKDNLYAPEKYSSEQFDEKLEKRYRVDINNSMKSIFDKLFEEVMQNPEEAELDALGIETDEGADEAADEGSDQVTVTLDRDMAKSLCDLLQAAMGEEDDDAEAEDGEYGEMEEMEEDEDEDTVDEAVDAEDHGHPLVNQKGGQPTPVTAGSNKVKSTVTPKSGKADSKINKQDDSEGTDEGHPLVNQKKGHPTKVSAGSNKVAASKANTPGASLFD